MWLLRWVRVQVKVRVQVYNCWQPHQPTACVCVTGTPARHPMFLTSHLLMMYPYHYLNMMYPYHYLHMMHPYHYQQQLCILRCCCTRMQVLHTNVGTAIQSCQQVQLAHLH